MAPPGANEGKTDSLDCTVSIEYLECHLDVLGADIHDSAEQKIGRSIWPQWPRNER